MILLTNRNIHSKEDVIKVVRLYFYRWRVEEYFRSKKQEYEFENIKLLGPRDYDFVLKQLYGDYMKLPDINDRNKHQLEILDDGEN